MGYFLNERAAIVAPLAGSFPHRFGGKPIHKFTGKPAKSLHVHCLYILSTSDPALPRVLTDVQWLPLYYPLFNNACDFAYKVISDDEVHIFLADDEVYPDFPYEGYPLVLPEHPVSSRALEYEEQKTLVYAFNAIDSGHREALSVADRALLQEIEYPCTQLGGIQQMTQGVMEQECPNPDCTYAAWSNHHEIFAVVWNNPVPGFQMWGEHMDDSQIIFQICPKCETICVCNRCG